MVNSTQKMFDFSNRKSLFAGVIAAAVVSGAFVSPDVRAFAVATITGADIVDGTVTAADLAKDSVDGNKIKNGSIKWSDLAADVVTTTKIKDGNVGNFDLTDNAVTSEKIADGTILRHDIASGLLPNGATNILYGSCELDVIVDAHSSAQGVCPPNFADGASIPGLRVGDHVVATLNNNAWPDVVLTSVTTYHDCEPEEDCIISYTMYNLGDEQVHLETAFGEEFFDFVAWNSEGDHE